MKLGKNDNVKIVGCGTGQSNNEKKTPYYTIEFENQEGDSIEAIQYLTENTKDRVLKTLVDIGFLGKRIADLSDPKKSIKDLFGPTAEPISITVKEEQVLKDGTLQWKDDAKTVPKMRQVVEWINVGEGGGISKFEHSQAVSVFASLTFDAEIQSLRKKAGGGSKPKSEPAKENASSTKEETYTAPAQGAADDEEPPF